MARKKIGDEAFVQMLVDDARLAAGGTPKARANRRKPSRAALHREMLTEAVCGCGNPAIVSVRVPSGRNGGYSYKKRCAECLGIAPAVIERPAPAREETPKPKMKRCGVKVFA